MQKRRSFLGSLLALFAPVPAVPGPFKRPMAPPVFVELPPMATIDWYAAYGHRFDGSYGACLQLIDAERRVAATTQDSVTGLCG